MKCVDLFFVLLVCVLCVLYVLRAVHVFSSLRSLTCFAFDVTPLSFCFFYKKWGDFVILPRSTVISHVNITIESAYDGGVYSCTAVNRVGRISHSGLVRVSGPPAIRVMKNQRSLEGNSIQLPCYVLGTPPPGTVISWTKDGGSKVIPFHHRQRILQNGSLEIVTLDKQIDSGSYTCSLEEKDMSTLTDSAGSSSSSLLTSTTSSSSSKSSKKIAQQSVHLDIKGKGDGRKRSVHTMMYLRSTKECVCFPSFFVESRQMLTTLLSVFFMSCVLCVLCSFLFLFTVPPVIEEFKFDRKLQKGMRTRVYCNVARGDTPVLLKWMKDSMPLLSEGEQQLQLQHQLSPSSSTPTDNSKVKMMSMMRGSSSPSSATDIPGVRVREIDEFSIALFIENLDAQHHNGNYSCIASNPAAVVNQSAQLVVNGIK